jgi:uncharacterized integral membrane protein
MRTLVWLLRAALFFSLFAFALNNQQESGVRWFFGQEWRAPMVFIVLTAFALGCACGAFAMLPSWWRQRRLARRHSHSRRATDRPLQPVVSEPLTPHPPRDGI